MNYLEDISLKKLIRLIKTIIAGKSDIGHTHTAAEVGALPAGGILSVSQGGTGHSTIEDTTYTTARYRASSLASAETTPTTNGTICWMYE